jgi:hypothetical protein
MTGAAPETPPAIQPAEIADWVWKLCHGTCLTGETLVVSGGLTVR